MSVIARLIAEHIEREELEAKKRELEIKATGVDALLTAIEARGWLHGRPLPGGGRAVGGSGAAAGASGGRGA